MDDLIKKRTIAKGQITRIETYFNNLQLEEASIEQVLERMEKLNKLFDFYEKIQYEIESNPDCTDTESQEAERANIETKYFNAKAYGRSLINELSKNNEASSATTTNESSPELNTAIQSLMNHQTALADLISRMPNRRMESDPSTSTNNQETRPTSDYNQQLKLQPIEVPLFNGNYKDWPEFYDLFNSLVHNNSILGFQ